jgi:hypothetical protein
MTKLTIQLYLSYSQICIFQGTLPQPFNAWSDRNVSQGFSWRPSSVSFRSLVDDGEHKVNLFINKPVPGINANISRAFRVPFETSTGNIEIASISDLFSLKVFPGKYLLQIEFFDIKNESMPEINIRFNQGESEFCILKADYDITVEGDLDLMSEPAD